MKKYDVFVVGASTTGCWFAYKMAKQGFKVLVIEKNQPDDVSREYDVFHMGKADMERFDLVIPPEGDPLREFCFGHSTMISPYGNYPKACAEAPVIGLHKHDYIMSIADRAKNPGGRRIAFAVAEPIVNRQGLAKVGLFPIYGDLCIRLADAHLLPQKAGH